MDIKGTRLLRISSDEMSNVFVLIYFWNVFVFD